MLTHTAVEGLPFVARAAPDLLVCLPNAVQFGHLGIEMATALACARAEGRAIAFLRDREVPNDAAFDLESDAVDIRRLSSVQETVWRCRWSLDRARAQVRTSLRECHEDVWDQVGRFAREEMLKPHHSPRMQTWLRALKTRAGRRPARPAAAPYFRRRLLRSPVPVRLRADVAARAAALAEELGIPRDAPLVTVHAREAGWKAGGREVQHKVSRVAGERPRDDATRNIRIETYVPAIDYLVSRGFTVVRLGDPSMRPVSRPGLIDVALDRRRTPALDVYCLLRSRFLMGGESGPSVFSLLTNTPTLTVNATDPVSSFPIRPDWLFTLKTVVDLETGQALDLEQRLTPRYIAGLRDTTRLRYVANTPVEILDAVRDMLAHLESPAPETPGQERVRQLVTDAVLDLAPRVGYVRKWGDDDGFLGDGRIAPSYVERYLPRS
ncbi:MAG: TIGR04372 family glycosyltransferase [Acidobacteria bacterium]|nr:TIGR04372 family glycosyltransferase [Acidobacteriota bacterium]